MIRQFNSSLLALSSQSKLWMTILGLTFFVASVVATSGLIKWTAADKTSQEKEGTIYDMFWVDKNPGMFYLGNIALKYPAQIYESDSAIISVNLSFNRGLIPEDPVSVQASATSLDFDLLPQEAQAHELKVGAQEAFDVIMEWAIRPKKHGNGIIRLELSNDPQTQFAVYEADEISHIEIYVLRDSGLNPRQEYYLKVGGGILAFILSYPLLITFLTRFFKLGGNDT